MPQIISFEEFKSIRRSGGSLPTIPLSQSSSSSTIMWSPTRDQKGREGKKREQQQQQIKEMMLPMSFEQFKIMRRTGQLPLVPPVLPTPNNSMSGNEQQYGKGAPQVMSFEEFKEMKRLLRSNNNEDSAHTTTSKKSLSVDKRGMKKDEKKKSLKKSRAKNVNSAMKKDSLGSKKMNSSKSSNKLQTIPNTKQQQQQKKNKVSNRLLSRKMKDTTKKKSLSISKEGTVQEEEEKKVLSPIPEVIAELTPTASSNGIETMDGMGVSVKVDDNVKTSEVEEYQSRETSLDIYSAMLNEAEPYLTTTSTKSMKKEEVLKENEHAEVIQKEERLSVDSEKNKREDVVDEIVEEEVEIEEGYIKNEVAPDLSMIVCADEEKIVGEDRIGFDSSSSNQKKADDNMVGKDVTIPSLNETSKPLVRALDFDDEVDVMEDQPVKMSEEKPKSESDNSKPGKKGRILHIRSKRKINKSGLKKTMKKILPSLGRSKSNKTEQLAPAEQGEVITDVKVFVPSPKADDMPVSPSAMSIISVESNVVISNDRGTIIDTLPVISGSPPQNLLYGTINYDFRNFDEHSDSHSDDAQPPESIPVLNVESPDEEEDSESICVEVIEQAQINGDDSVATQEVAVVACDEVTKDIKIEVGHYSNVTTDDTKAMDKILPESTFQKEAETEEVKVDESVLTESNEISYLDEYQQALLASYIHDMNDKEEGTGAEEDVGEYLQAPDTTQSDQTSIARSVAVEDDSSSPCPIIHVEHTIKEEEPAIFIGDINDEDEPEDELVITTKSQKSIKLSVETTPPSPSTFSSVVPKKSFESGMQKRKIPSTKSTTSSYPKSASKKCSNGLVKSRISDIQQRIDALSSTSSSFDNHGRGTGRYSYSHPLPSPTCSVSSATSSISSRMSSSSYIRTVPIGIAKTYSQNLESPSGSVVGLGFGNSAFDIDNNQWQDERATTVSYAQKYIK